jgi:2-methylcitrate dehydratase PrpD
MSYTKDLVRFIVDHKKESLSEKVIEQAKLLVLDTVGCAIGGYCTDLGKQVVSMAGKYRAPGESALIGDGTRVCAEFAGWANSSLANILDMDDVFAGTAHQGNCLIPAAFAMGESTGASGLEVLHAIVLGFEVGSRIGLHAWPSPEKARTYFPSTWQVFDAVTAAGKLLQLGEEGLYHAFGLAGTIPPVPIDMQKFVERPMGFAKNVFGWTTFTGMFWTRMAEKGAQGTPDILDGDAGFWKIMGSDTYEPAKLTQGLGETFNILDTKFKPYPLCTWGHTSVDAVKKILEENRIDAADIEAVRVRTVKRAVDFLSNPKMDTIFDAQFSLPHAVSMLALRKKPGPEWMSKENIFENPEAKAIASKVSMEADPLAEKVFFEENGLAIPSHVEIRTGNGKTYHEDIRYSKGTPNNPFSREEVEDKFKTLTSSLLNRDRAARVMEVIGELEHLGDISALTEIWKG